MVTKEKQNEVIDIYYKTKSTRVTAKSTKLGRNTVKNILIENKIIIDGTFKKPINENFFKYIDSEQKAYILGFILADGCIMNKYQVGIKINDKDIDILIKIKMQMGSKHVISRKSRYDKRTKKYYNSATFVFGSKEIINDLNKLGIKPRKSTKEDINLDLIPEELQCHFWRGVIDGDGSIQRNDKHYTKRIVLYGSKIICAKFKVFAEECVNKKLVPKVYYHHGVYQIAIGSKNEVVDLLHILYTGSKIYLKRKHNLAMDIIDSIAG